MEVLGAGDGSGSGAVQIPAALPLKQEGLSFDKWVQFEGLHRPQSMPSRFGHQQARLLLLAKRTAVGKVSLLRDGSKAEREGSGAEPAEALSWGRKVWGFVGGKNDQITFFMSKQLRVLF